MPDRGRPIANWAFIDDVVEGHIQAMAAGKSGRRYILGGDNASFSEFIHILKQQGRQKLHRDQRAQGGLAFVR